MFRRKTTRSSIDSSLSYQVFESRILLASIRLANWNVDNGPNSLADDQSFETVIDAIGQEDVLGATRALDVLVLSETDTASAEQLNDVFNDLYNTSTFNQVISSADAGGDRTGFIYNSQTVSLLETFELPDNSLTHHMLRAHFRPFGGTAQEDFFVYAVHLKSGTGGTNRAIRAAEANVIRTDADTLGPGSNIIYAGDFNLSGSSEAAWSTIHAAGNGSAFDAANAPGEWTENSAFAQWHTHSVTQMDGRFDMQFISNTLVDGLGLDYVDGSVHVFGNNGTHNFNGSIDSGTGADPFVLNALKLASDHLPIVADFEIVSPTPGVAIVQSGGATEVTEGGSVDSYQLSLRTIPVADVVITVVPDNQVDVGAGPGQSIDVVYTSQNATTLQTVTVTAFDDTLDEGLHVGMIEHFVSSLDADYDQAQVDPIFVSISDNDSLLNQPLLNEIFVNPPNADDNREYIELIGPASSSLQDVWLLEVEGDGANSGVVDNARNLSSLSFGSNGLLLLGDDYLSAGNPWKSELDPATTVAELANAPIENGSITFLLVENFSDSTGVDLDTNNDGQFDLTPWQTILDSVGWNDGGTGDQVYSQAILTQAGVPDAATRIPNSFQPVASSAWYNGDIVGSGTDTSYGPNGSANLPENAKITPGARNFFPFEGNVSSDALQIVTGSLARGGLPELEFSDDQYVRIFSANVEPFISPAVWFEFNAISPDPAPESLTLMLEIRASTPNISTQIEIFNVVNQQFELVEVQPAAVVDELVTTAITVNTNDYVAPFTGEIQTRVQLTAVSLVNGFPWSIYVDQATWGINTSNPSPLMFEPDLPFAESEPRSNATTANLEDIVPSLPGPHLDRELGEDLRGAISLYNGVSDLSLLYDRDRVNLIDNLFEFESIDDFLKKVSD